MAFGKRPSNEKATRIINAPRQEHSEEVKKLNGCHVPLPSGCVRGGGPVQATGDGVKMECSNVSCPFKDALIHRECFEALENNLIKIMSNIGSGRGWTDAQRRANLWDRKGLAFVQKLCRCPCTMGVLRFDRKAKCLAESSSTTIIVTNSKNKKAKAKKLPKLNFNGSTAATVSTDQKTCDKSSKNKQQNSSQRYRSTSFCGKSSSSRTSERQFVKKTSCATATTMTTATAKQPKETTPKSVWITNMSSAPLPLVFSPRKNCGPITYAEAAQCALSNTSDYSSESDSVSRRTSSASDSVLSDGCSVYVTESLTDSYRSLSLADEQMSTYSTSNEYLTPTSKYHQQHATSFERNAAKIDMSTVMLSPPITPPIYAENDEETYQTKIREPSNEMDDDGISVEMPYDLFNGHSFDLGEMLFAERFLPGIFC